MLFRSANWSPRRWPSCTQLYFDAWLERRRHAAVEAPALGGIRCPLDQLDVVLWLVDLCRNRVRAHQVSREGLHRRARHRDAGQMRWLCAVEDAISIARGAPKIIGYIDTVGDQTANFSVEPSRSNNREAI